MNFVDESDVTRNSQKTFNKIPTEVTVECPDCGQKHSFELVEESVTPDPVKDKVLNDASPVYEAECLHSEFGIVRFVDTVLDIEW